MNSFNDEVCEYTPKPVTENFANENSAAGTCIGWWLVPDANCSSGCQDWTKGKCT
jgi:hypothetical protein